MNRLEEIKERLIDFDATVTNDLDYPTYKIFKEYISDINFLLEQLSMVTDSFNTAEKGWDEALREKAVELKKEIEITKLEKKINDLKGSY